MEKEIVCSIVMPVFNAEKYLKQTITQVLCQTEQRFELICVDDCSKDGSVNIIKEFMKQDERIKLVQNEKNLKVSQTRNIGIKMAKANTIALLDSDDLWLPNALLDMLNLKQEKNAPLVCGTHFLINDDGTETGKVFKVKPQFSYKQYLKQNCILCSFVVVDKALLLKYPFYADDVHEDYLCWLSIMKEIKTAYGVTTPVGKYRLTKGSKSRNKFKAIKMSYKTYKKHGLNFFVAHHYTFCNAINGIIKYFPIAFKKLFCIKKKEKTN